MACSANAAALSCTSTGVTFAAGPQQLCIDCREAGACTFWIGGQARTRLKTNLPGNTQVGNTISLETTSAAVRQLLVGASSIETR
jgi:hypothetical protein